MSALMKKHLTDGVKIQVEGKKTRIFILPKIEADGLIQMLSKYELKDSVPWRESLSKTMKKYSEGGAMLKSERLLAELTQVDLAKKIKVPQHVISELENGKRPIGKVMAARFAKVFKTDYRLFL